MLNLVHAGFDTLDVAFAGALPPETLSVLERAREEAAEQMESNLVTIGPGEVAMHVLDHGMRGGYAFIGDTGPTGSIWKFKKNADPRQWNIFASPRATALLAHGYKGTRDMLFGALKAMGATISDHAINRADFAMDFRTEGFELHPDQIVAHPHATITSRWGEDKTMDGRNQPVAVVRGRCFESVTVGKQPGRQIIVYDKRREAVARQKHFWFETWGLDRKDPTIEVWRVEIRGGKTELKEKYQIRRFEDFEAGIGDVVVNSLREIRYIARQQNDSNVTRQELHPLWREAQKVASANLLDFRSGLTPGQIKEIERTLAIERYSNLVFGNAVGLSVAKGLTDDEVMERLPSLIAECAAKMIKRDKDHLRKALGRTRARLHFINRPRDHLKQP